MALTPKMDAFCLAFLETGNRSEAYRQAYDTSKMKPETVHKRASELAMNGEVKGRIAELRAAAAEKAVVSLGEHLFDLQRMRDIALERGKYSAAISAEVARGKAAGLHSERHDDPKQRGFVETVSEEENLEAWAQKHGS